MTRTTIAACLSAALALSGVRGAEAQPSTRAAGDLALRRIWSLGMDSSQVERLAQALTDSIGPRLTGTPGQRAANEWAVATYRGWGIDARTEQYGTWRGWRRGITHIDLIAPRVRTLEGMMLAWSPGTRGRVEGGVVVLPAVATTAEFEAWLPQARGKFVLISRAEASCRPDTNWVTHATPASLAAMRAARTAAIAEWTSRVERTGLTLRDLPQRLERAGAVGVVTSLWSGGWGVDRIFGARTELVPMLDVSCEDYGLLFRLAERRQGPVLRVEADAEMLGQVPVFNTIAEILGTELPDEYVMMSAHFDSWDGASGATDNATGTVTMMEAMRILKTVYPRPRRTILVGHWSGEEQGLNGSRAFAADHPEVVNGLQALFNQDNGTGRIVNFSGSGFTTASGNLARWMASIPAEMSRGVNLSFPGSPAGGGSDNASFVCYGAPAFGLGATSWDYGTYTWHTNRDTFDKIVLDDLKNNATLTAMLVYLASEDPETLSRDRRVFDQGPDRRPGPGFGGGGGGGGPQQWPTCTEPLRDYSQYRR